jgi:hypothetical protein
MLENKEIKDMLEKILKDPSLRNDFAKIIIQCIRENWSLQDLMHEIVGRKMADELRRRGVF